jgi:CBS domain-containing protein
MNTVGRMLKSKGTTVWTISKESLVSEAIKMFVDKQISSVIVMDGEEVCGIFTERDFSKKLGYYNISPTEVQIENFMTKELITVDTTTSVNICMALMTDKHIRHLPVFHKGKLVGIVSIGDVLKDLIEELQFMVVQLDNYIKGFR